MATRRKAPFSLLHLLLFTLVASFTLPDSAPAQVVRDGTLGGQAGPVGPGTIPGVGTTTYHITDSLGKRAGQNLFHSFSSFNVSSGECATFTSASNGIRNVVSRVTGGHSSTIDGTLRSTIQGASLYFLNPCGVVFGPNASLDVKGSFHVSTADYLRFEDGISFHSTPSASDQVLSTASPVAFGFLSASPGPVYASQSFLEVPAGETLSIVGGEIGLHGAYLSAPGGRIHLASMAFPGEVIPSPAGSPPGILVLPEKASGSIGIDGASILSVDGAPSGTILIRGGRLVLDNEAFISANNEGDLPASWSVIGIAADNVTLDNGSWMLAAAFGAGKGATIEIDAKNIVLSHESLIGALPWWESTGDGGDIKIATSRLEISGASFISTDNRGFGRGGLLRAEATGSIRLADTYSGLSSAAWSDGGGGKIVLKTPHLLLENEAMVYGDSFGDGRGGEISIAAGKLSLLSGASISSNSFGPAGNGGDLSVSATESISISGIGPTGLKSSLENRTTGAGNAGRIRVITPLLDIGEHGSISAETLGAGRAGDIDVTVDRLSLTGGGRISNSAFGTTGNGGDVSIRATDSVMISGTGTLSIPSGLFSYTGHDGEGEGDAGKILLSAPNLTLTSGASIGADTFGAGRAGDIVLDVQQLTLSGGANITSGSTDGSGRGGDILLTASNAVTLSGLQSDISTSTAGVGDGGNVTISSGALTLQDQAAIYADTSGGGQGGSIQIKVGALSVHGGSRISSSSYDSIGNGGHVTIQADKNMSFNGSFSGVYSVSSGAGTGGDIQLKAAEIRFTDGAQISASSEGTGDAGDIDIAASGSIISTNSKVSTSSEHADGGNIRITAPHRVHLKSSEITASVGGGASTVGGNISIDPQFVILDHSKIIANAYEGQGGNIQIVSNVFLADPSSVIDASSALGIDGTVDIRAPITEISGTLVPLGEDFISAFGLLREPCIARIRGGKYSSFIVSGRDGLPMEPGRLLPSPMPQ